MSDNHTISRSGGYSSIPNAAVRDASLSIEARGFLALIMSMSAGWVFRRNNLMKTAGIGRDKYRRIVKELEAAGYLRITPTHDDSGKFMGNHWHINDIPQPQDVDTEGLKTRPTATEGLKNPLSVKPAGGETRPLKKNNSNKKNNSQGEGGFGASKRAYEKLKEEGYFQ